MVIQIEPGFRITLPDNFRTSLRVGDEVIVVANASGAITLIPKTRALEILEQTAGLWAGRADVPEEGIEYVNALRPGRRLRDLGQRDASDAESH
ncbi:MAG: hypothetical protein NZM11_02090 [Anaerolineales bacterium]|nr:hypothetical protein [Anaerolineales bacterium]